MTKEEERRAKAKALRYKKAIVSGLSLETIEYDTMEMRDACYEVQWASQADLIDELLGEDEAAEFKMMFAGLENDLDRFCEDIHEEWVPECYEDFMTAVAGRSGASLLGWDDFEEDYFGISPGYESEIACQESGKRLERLTKKDLIRAAQQCFNIAFQYIGIKNRYEQLQASIDVLRGETKGLFETIKSIDEAWEKACSGDAWRDYKRFGYTQEMRHFESLLEQFDPYDRIWIE